MPITIPSLRHSPTRTSTLVIAPPRALPNAEWSLSTRVQHLHLLRFTLATFPPPASIIYNHLDYSTPHRPCHLIPPHIKYSIRGWNPFLHLLGTPLTIHTGLNCCSNKRIASPTTSNGKRTRNEGMQLSAHTSCSKCVITTTQLPTSVPLTLMFPTSTTSHLISSSPHASPLQHPQIEAHIPTYVRI